MMNHKDLGEQKEQGAVFRALAKTDLWEVKMSDKRNIVCVGVSKNHDSAHAGREAARMAADLLARDESIAWALAFCGGRLDPPAGLRVLGTYGQHPLFRSRGQKDMEPDWAGLHHRLHGDG